VVAAEAIIARLNVRHEDLTEALNLMLGVFERDLHDLYLRANVTQRRLINQAIFKAIWVHHEDVERVELNSPFEEARAIAEAARTAEQAAAAGRVREIRVHAEVRLERESSRPLAGTGALARGRLVNLWWS
jgi:hypothetical protein